MWPRLVKRCIAFLFLSHILSEDGLPLLLTQTMFSPTGDGRRSRQVRYLILILAWLVYDAWRCREITSESHTKAAANKAEVVRHHDVCKAVMDMVCPYDAEDCEALRRFAPVVKMSRCLFAKGARLWGSKDYDETLSLESNVAASVPTLLQMLHRGEVEGLDGFVFEIRASPSVPGDLSSDLEAFAAAVRRLLFTISNMDPTGERSARKAYIHDRAWHFTFARFPIFVTTFAPCYGPTSSRYTYGADPESAFVLLQPEYSFLRHDLPADTPHTEWDNPKTIRDRIRVSFRDAGQAYDIPNTVHYPASEHIVKALVRGQQAVRWWETSDAERLLT